MSRVVLLTRPANWQGIVTLDELAREGVRVAAAIVETKTSGDRIRRLRKFMASNGPLDTARKVWHNVVSDRRFRREISRAGLDSLPRTVAAMTTRLNIPTYSVRSHNDEECERLLRQIEPEVVLLAGTRIIKPHIIRQARLGCLNAHTGWLPEYRGVHANLWALLEGGRVGVTTHYVDPGVDTGAILLQEELPVLPGDTLETLEVRTTQLCARLMRQALDGIQQGSLRPRPQHAGDGRQYRALPFDKEQEVRRLLRRLARTPVGQAQYERR
jgi:folate-dependent phosphoribosylglycinamide formyltransferase PurN